jgi:hypothetical protein
MSTTGDILQEVGEYEAFKKMDSGKMGFEETLALSARLKKAKEEFLSLPRWRQVLRITRLICYMWFGAVKEILER